MKLTSCLLILNLLFLIKNFPIGAKLISNEETLRLFTFRPNPEKILRMQRILLFEKIVQAGQVQGEKNTTLFGQQFIICEKMGQNNIEESKTLNKITMKPRRNFKFTKKVFSPAVLAAS